MSSMSGDTQSPETPLIEPLEREQRLYEKVVDKILELIAANTWPAGHRLPPERELAEAFGVSRTVVREAVERGDADASRRAMMEHMAYSQEVLESLISLAAKKTPPSPGN